MRDHWKNVITTEILWTAERCFVVHCTVRSVCAERGGFRLSDTALWSEEEEKTGIKTFFEWMIIDKRRLKKSNSENQVNN
ncbi:palmitoyltransferase, putative (DHHC3) [Plasmodium ovale wallikeri]|uniref:Palmitoyltransferase, putative (DHHC3) n=1 Tax=Plasmodium ovale wallikeri TaxID=864142 RepID=A0A1A8YUM1_PLAOA|nr:palmitoyltransferase, putative (DHHC3) [Plasmodium ovale wallikeri]SBT35701.1 palmitoyltransferase, putative (DHHC3) [Plasmodium ovale wallikeri]